VKGVDTKTIEIRAKFVRGVSATFTRRERESEGKKSEKILFSNSNFSPRKNAIFSIQRYAHGVAQIRQKQREEEEEEETKTCQKCFRTSATARKFRARRA
jgi:hypothetical protein